MQLLQGLLAAGAVGGDITPSPLNANTRHDASRMDRAEALVWTLGGYSSNPLMPFTGDGGPLSLVPGTGVGTVPAKYQINLERDNALFEFDQQRLDLAIDDKDAPINEANYWYSKNEGTPADVFPHYAAHDDGAPFVYFDSRTYISLGYYSRINPNEKDFRQFNLFNGGDYGSIRPYVGTGNLTDGYQFINPESFQVIAPGVDGSLGYSTWSGGTASNNQQRIADYFRYPSGTRASLTQSIFGFSWVSIRDESSKYQEPREIAQVDHPHQDNLTNFADGKLIDELQE